MSFVVELSPTAEADLERLFQPGKQRREQQLAEMTDQVGEADQADQACILAGRSHRGGGSGHRGGSGLNGQNLKRTARGAFTIERQALSRSCQ